MTEVRNILPFLVDRLRVVERSGMTVEQVALMNLADRRLRRGEAGEAFKLRMEAAGLAGADRNTDR